jgi:hypothetical protein
MQRVSFRKTIDAAERIISYLMRVLNVTHTYIHTNIHTYICTLIYDCPRLKKERNKLRAAVNKTEKWPINKENLLKRHYKEFLKFVNSISLEDLNA